MSWGATPDDWAHFDLNLGATADLLPVVSNPDAKISAASKMKGLGKTPSRYNAAGEVAGIKDWTDQRTTPQQIAKWSAQPDYGICLQTREFRALDIDVPDTEVSDAIRRDFLDALNLTDLPTRTRADSGKQLLLFRMPDDLRKRSFKVEGGLVELLATGQQCIVAGTHTQGARYEWDEPPREITLTLELLEKAWAFIVERWAVEPERRARDRTGTSDSELATDDPVAQWLTANWETYDSDGEKLFLLCPFKDGHSGDSGETEAAWLLAGTAGYERGHFACLHASCSGRTDGEFLKAVGMPATDKSDFTALAAQKPADRSKADPAALYLAAAEGLPKPAPKVSTGVKKTAAHPEGVAALPLPGFERKPNGEVLATIGNVAKAAASSVACGYDLRFDTFRSELVISAPGEENWRPFEDADAVEMRIRLAHHRFEPVGKELMRDAVVLVSREQRFDTAINWLEKLCPEWDGVERIETFYADYFNAEDTPYTRACGLYVWTAQAGRVLDPGCQADMAPVLVGEQGLRKSSGVKAMSPAPEFFAEIDLDLKDADLSRSLRGLLVGELGELKGLAGRESEAIRAWITKKHERWTPKYQEYGTTFARRLLFHGTTNNEHFLADPTGERRWLPMLVLGMVEVDRIEADRPQLWAEARERWKREGVLYAEAERLAKFEHAAFKSMDPWEGPVNRWLDNAETDGLAPRYSPRGVRAEVVMVMALGLDISRTGKRDEMRLGDVLKACGMVRDLRRQADGRPAKVWVDSDGDLG